MLHRYFYLIDLFKSSKCKHWSWPGPYLNKLNYRPSMSAEIEQLITFMEQRSINDYFVRYYLILAFTWQDAKDLHLHLHFLTFSFSFFQSLQPAANHIKDLSEVVKMRLKATNSPFMRCSYKHSNIREHQDLFLVSTPSDYGRSFRSLYLFRTFF